MQPAFTVSGVLIQKDGTPYIQYSSPIYRITTNEEGEEKHDRDDTLYLFTDQDGRFILNEVKAGSYLFDLKVDDDWYGVRFDVPEQDAKTMGINTILLLESYQVDDPAFEGRVSYFDKVAVLLEAQIEDAFHVEVADEYDARLTLNVIEQTDEESFWNAIFPSFDEDPFFGFDDAFVTDDDFYFDPLVFDEMIGDWESPPTEQTVTTAAP
jgi:outer membrane usher protein